MKKTYRIDVDCANCADKMELAAQKTAGVKNAAVNFHARSPEKLQKSRRRLRNLFITAGNDQTGQAL